MSFKSILQNLTKSWKYNNVRFKGANEIENINGQYIVSTKTIIKGSGEININIEKGKCLCIEGNYSGNILGKKGSYLKLIGSFEGNVQVDVIEIESNGMLNGKINVKMMRIQPGARMNTKQK